MIVDPVTGQPVQETAIGAQSALGAAGQAAIGDQTALTYELLGHLPGMGTVAAWNMGRGVSTIMGGEYYRGRRWGNFGKRQHFGSQFVNTMSPLRLGSFSDPANITGRRGAAAAYSPFNFMGHYGNIGAQKLAQRSIDITDKNAQSKMLTRMGLSREQIGNVAAGNETVFDSGVLARLGASQRLSYMRPGRGGELSRSNRKRLAKSIYSMNRMGIDVSDLPGAAQVLSTGNVRAGAETLRGVRGVGIARMAGTRMMGSFTGLHTQRMAGYMAGIMPGGMAPRGGQAYKTAFIRTRFNMYDDIGRVFGQNATGDIMEAGGRKSLRYAAQAAGKAGGSRLATNLAVKGLTKVGTRAIPIVGWATLAADLGGAALSVVKRGAELTSDAAKSFQGQIQKPIFGMGYKDNAINATSRSRGLTAIQSSRLNARNALGHEAGMLASHFS